MVRNISDSVKAVLIPEGAHHLDLRAQNPADPVSVRGARRVHRQAIRRWVKQHWNWLAADQPGVVDRRDNRLQQRDAAGAIGASSEETTE